MNSKKYIEAWNAGKQEYPVQRKLFIKICWKPRIPDAEKDIHYEYEHPVQRELCMLNMLACKNSWCRGSYSCCICWHARMRGAEGAMYAEYVRMQECLVHRENAC